MDKNTITCSGKVEFDFSTDGHKAISSDERSLLVHAALREKLSSKTQGKSEPEMQLERSELHLQELIKFGNELVSNIKSSHEHQELLRSKKKHEKEVDLQENLRNEAELSLGQFDEISKKWRDMNDIKEPMGIYEEMQRQRENIENLMASKNELIDQCKQELERVNKKYYEDQDKQYENICILVERVDQQIRLLKNTYKSSFNNLQNCIETEQQQILQSAKEKWNIVHDQLVDKEAKKGETLKEKQTFYAQELDSIRRKQEEVTRTTKIRLEKDTELLEIEIRKAKANIFLNSEKIDYNYQVLQKRNEENIVINNHQKRRVAKLNEAIVALKKKLFAIKSDNTLAMEKLTLDIQKLHSSINDLHAKLEHFRKHNSIKLAKIWNINFKEIKHLVTRVSEIDRILYEQQLGRKWKPPNIDLDQLDYTKYFQTLPKPNTLSIQQHKTNPTTLFTDQKYLHDILFKISDRAGFLVEDKLLEILAPYTDAEQCLVKIESIFAALNITNIKEVESLMKYFEPYSWCKNCSPERATNSLCPEENTSNATNSMNSSKIVCENHTLYMEPAFVLCALNDFMSREVNSFGKSAEIRYIPWPINAGGLHWSLDSQLFAPELSKGCLCIENINKTSDNSVENCYCGHLYGARLGRKSKTKMDLDLLQVDRAEISRYWQQFASHMSKEQQETWQLIERGLNHYLEVLKKRAQIHNECVFLHNQNAELKHLLQKL